MRRRWMVVGLASLISCGGPDGERTGYLFTQTASGAPPLVEANTWKRRSMLPMALGVEEHPAVVTRSGTRAAVTLAPRQMKVVNADSGDVETLVLGEDVASDALLVHGSTEAVHQLAALVDAEVTPSGRDFVLHSDELLERMSFLELPTDIDRVDIVRLSHGATPVLNPVVAPVPQPLAEAPAAKLHALLSSHGIASGTLRLGTTPTQLSRTSVSNTDALGKVRWQIRPGIRFREETYEDARVLELFPDGRATMTLEQWHLGCDTFAMYDVSAGRYAVDGDSIELTFTEVGESTWNPPTTFDAIPPQRVVFGPRDGALYERGGASASHFAWKAIQGEEVTQLRELLEKKGMRAFDAFAPLEKDTHPVAAFLALAKEPLDRGRLTLLSDGTFEFKRTRFDGGGCLGEPVPADLKGWFFVHGDELNLVPTTEVTEDWMGEHYVYDVAAEPLAYQLRKGTLVAQASQKNPWREYMTPIARLELDSCDAPIWQSDPETGECHYMEGQ